uniref:Uncharacterized protein n=1 Tax=Anguilla anguilla TaxID=7936 RepID=A0A0E9WKB0_ANGAN
MEFCTEERPTLSKCHEIFNDHSDSGPCFHISSKRCNLLKRSAPSQYWGIGGCFRRKTYSTSNRNFSQVISHLSTDHSSHLLKFNHGQEEDMWWYG